MRSHKSEIGARNRILNSRNAFIPLMGLFSYAIAISMTHSAERDDRTPRWVRSLIESNKFDSELVNEFALHSHCRPTTVRVGVYIDWESFTPTNLFQYYVRFRVPVWVRLTKSMPRRISNNLPDVLKVTPAEYTLAQNPTSREGQQVPSSASASASALKSAYYTAPRLFHIPGEHIRGYLARYYEFRMRMIEAESQDELASRLEREQHALQFICPSRDGEHIFEWQETSTGLKRQLISQDRVPIIWMSYSNSQKFYNSIHDEWDLCRDLDPDAGSLNPDDGELITPSLDDILQSTENVDILTRSIMEDTYTRSIPFTHSIHIPTIDETLFVMYGFLPDGTQYVAPDPLIPAQRIPRILVEASMSGNNQPMEQIIHFISALVRGPDQVPSSLCDLHKDNIYCLKAQRFPLFTWAKIEDHLFVFRQINDPSVCLYVPSAVHVVQSIRLPACDTLLDLASIFGLKGERFHLGELVQRKNPFESPPACVSGLGFRRKGFKPDWLDYQAYVNRRARLLSDPAVARAALMQGGIVWRLAVDTLYELHGQVDFESYFTRDIEPAYLSLHDLGVIVGLYRIWSGIVFSWIVLRYLLLIIYQMKPEPTSSYLGGLSVIHGTEVVTTLSIGPLHARTGTRIASKGSRMRFSMPRVAQIGRSLLTCSKKRECSERTMSSPARPFSSHYCSLHSLS